MIPQEEFRTTYRQINTINELAEFFGVEPYQLTYYAFHVDKKKAYKVFFISRRNGLERRIEAPKSTLKFIQRIIHESLVRVYGPHPSVHGFLPERSIVTNAQNHLGRRYVLNIDLENFFPCISRKRIYGRLVTAPYEFNSRVANLIAAISTNAYSRLPQGSPSSPIIANIVASQLDSDLARLCGPLGCWYTRYADDITISTSRKKMSPKLARYPNAHGTVQAVVGDELLSTIERHGFSVNYNKTRLQSYWTRQLCTGLVVNGNRISTTRSYIRSLRSLINHWRKNGWENAAQVLNSKENRPLFRERQRIMNHIAGRIAYLKMVRGPSDRIVQRFEHDIASLP